MLLSFYYIFSRLLFFPFLIIFFIIPSPITFSSLPPFHLIFLLPSPFLYFPFHSFVWQHAIVFFPSLVHFYLTLPSLTFLFFILQLFLTRSVTFILFTIHDNYLIDLFTFPFLPSLAISLSFPPSPSVHHNRLSATPSLGVRSSPRSPSGPRLW